MSKKSRAFTKAEIVFLVLTAPIGVPMVTFLFLTCYVPSFVYRVYKRVQEKLNQEELSDGNNLGVNEMATQKRIYELAQLTRKGDANAVKEMDSLKKSGQIAYDLEEYWYRPINDIGKPLDMVLYREFFG